MSLKAFYNIFKSFELYTFPSQEFHTLHDVPTEICSNLKNEAWNWIWERDFLMLGTEPPT